MAQIKRLPVMWETGFNPGVGKVAVEHRELCSTLHGSLDGREVWGRIDTCMAESLCGPPETITILLISYTPIQNEEIEYVVIKYKQSKINIT